MTEVYIGVESDQYRIHIPLERRVTYLRGDSGVGKTTFVNYVTAGVIDEDPTIHIEYPTGYNVVVLNYLQMAEQIKIYKNAILIIDDSIQAEDTDFSNAVVNCLLKNNLYLLIINRVEILGLSSEKSTSFDYAVGSILWVEKNGMDHKVTRLIDREKDIHSTPFSCDKGLILCEDKYGMSEFCENNRQSLVTIDHTSPKSKDNIVSILNDYLSEGTFTSILLYVDLASFGKYYWSVRAIQEENNIVIDNNYESFEYMILKSNRFKSNFELSSEANDVFSWEQYFEIQLQKLSKIVLPYSYRHGKSLPICFYTVCKECSKEQYCKKKIEEPEENILEVFFKDTEFEYLITILGR